MTTQNVDGRTADSLLTTGEVAKLCRVNPVTVRRWAEQGLIEAVTLPGGHQRRYPKAAIDALLNPPKCRHCEKPVGPVHVADLVDPSLVFCDDDCLQAALERQAERAAS